MIFYGIMMNNDPQWHPMVQFFFPLQVLSIPCSFPRMIQTLRTLPRKALQGSSRASQRFQSLFHVILMFFFFRVGGWNIIQSFGYVPPLQGLNLMESQSTTIIVGMHYCPPLMTGLIGAIFLSHSRPCNECEHAISLPFGDGLNPTQKMVVIFGMVFVTPK